jgi:hypothetical protein
MHMLHLVPMLAGILCSSTRWFLDVIWPKYVVCNSIWCIEGSPSYNFLVLFMSLLSQKLKEYITKGLCSLINGLITNDFIGLSNG